MDFDELQERSHNWRSYNFPGSSAEDQLIGALEELGELAHANLKGRQRIRNGQAIGGLLDAEKDAVGDVIIYLAGYCSARGFSMQDCVERTWAEVEERDWVKNPTDGS